LLLFSVHPEPEGRKVDKMLTLKKVKEMVKAPVHTKRVPSPKVLLEDGRILLRKEFEHDSHLTLYHSGYVWFSTGKRNTVFHIHDCCGDYLVFFKAKDVDVMTAAFKEYTSETLKKQKRESVRQKLEKVKEELSNHRQLKKEKKREQEPIR